MRLLILLLLFLQLTQGFSQSQRTFVIQDDEFVLNAQWRHRLQMAKAMYVNTIQFYIPWNFHNPTEGVYNYEGIADVESFIRLAHEMKFLVMIRLGPYICGEHDAGGLPGWLVDLKAVRTYDEPFIAQVDKWLDNLLPRLIPHMFANGGPVIMFQVENEYGSYGNVHENPNDLKYLRYLVMKAKSYFGQDAIIYTTDGWKLSNMLRGSVNGTEVLSLPDFGWKDATEPFAAAAQLNPPGRRINMDTEFYPGWLTHWGEKLHRTSTDEVVKYLKLLLDPPHKGSVNLYMGVGGTNFGFWAGANGPDDGSYYQPTITSYDYDAPVTEGGQQGKIKIEALNDNNPTGFGPEGKNKFLGVRELFSKYNLNHPELRENTDIPEPAKARAYGAIELDQSVSLLAHLDAFSVRKFHTHTPMHMEQYGFYFGFILYSVQVPLASLQAVNNITLPSPRDRVHVLVNDQLAGIIYRMDPNKTVSFATSGVNSGTVEIKLLFENMGRINFGKQLLNNQKGLYKNQFFINGKQVDADSYWTIRTINLETRAMASVASVPSNAIEPGSSHLTFFRGSFEIAAESDVADSYIELKHFTKGYVLINGVNIGQYWTTKGPQQTLFIPAPLLRQGSNEVEVFELDQANEAVVRLRATPCLTGPCDDLGEQQEMSVAR